MYGVSTVRLYVLRAAYLLIFVGLGFMIWPLLLNPPADVEHMRGVVWSLLGGVSLLAALGLRYPLQMLPVLLLELAWKSLWLLAIGFPQWSVGALGAGEQETWNDCLVSVVLLFAVIPWGYVWTHYVRRPGDGWRSGPASGKGGDASVDPRRAPSSTSRRTPHATCIGASSPSALRFSPGP